MPRYSIYMGRHRRGTSYYRVDGRFVSAKQLIAAARLVGINLKLNQDGVPVYCDPLFNDAWEGE